MTQPKLPEAPDPLASLPLNKRTQILNATRSLRSEVADRPFFRSIGYSNCWEDPAILQEALQVKPGDVCFSVTSGGCNTLSLLLHDPAKVVALDFNASQNHLLRFKIAAFQSLDYGEMLEALGVRRSMRRRKLFQKLRPNLTVEAKQFWDEHQILIDKGVYVSGRIERYLLAFGKLMRMLYGRKKIRRMFESGTLEEQKQFYDQHIDGPIWRTIFDVFFSRTVMTRAKDKEHFRLVDFDDFGRIFRKRAEHALTGLPIRSNYFVSLIMLGHYLDEDALPAYLSREHFETMKARVGRVEIFTGEIEQFLVSMPPDTFDKFNISNLVDWIKQPMFVRLHQEIVRIAKPGARLANWNTLLARSIPSEEVPQIVREPELAARLLKADRAFLYANFEVGAIQK